MIALSNIAFDFLRKHKPVSEEVEKLVLQKVGNRVTKTELLTIFENGISGQYGKVYSLDAATLIGWVNQYQAAKNKANSFVDGNLLNPATPVNSINYPLTAKEWFRETNKAFTSYLSGVHESNWHPHIYHHLVMDAKIPFGAMKKYTPESYPLCAESETNKAMQLCIMDYFAECKSKGYTYIYHPKMCE